MPIEIGHHKRDRVLGEVGARVAQYCLERGSLPDQAVNVGEPLEGASREFPFLGIDPLTDKCD